MLLAEAISLINRQTHLVSVFLGVTGLGDRGPPCTVPGMLKKVVLKGGTNKG